MRNSGVKFLLTDGKTLKSESSPLISCNYYGMYDMYTDIILFILI